MFFRIAYVLMFFIAVELIRSSVAGAVVAAEPPHAAMREIGWRGARFSALTRGPPA